MVFMVFTVYRVAFRKYTVYMVFIRFSEWVKLRHKKYTGMVIKFSFFCCWFILLPFSLFTFLFLFLFPLCMGTTRYWGVIWNMCGSLLTFLFFSCERLLFVTWHTWHTTHMTHMENTHDARTLHAFPRIIRYIEYKEFFSYHERYTNINSHSNWNKQIS